MLHSLILQNFKQHEDLTVDFDTGLNVITGPNYSGKTTLLEAVNFALWGVSTVPGGSTVAMRRGANKQSVEVYFSVSGQDYRVRRTQAGASLWQGDELIAKSQSAVNSKIEELLGITKRRFMQLKYGQQSETKALLTMGATELHKIIEELSGVDVVNRVLSKATGMASNLKSVLEQLPEHDLSVDEQNAADLDALVDSIGADMAISEGALAQSKTELKQAEDDLGAARLHNQQLRNIIRDRTNSEQNLTLWRSKLADAKQREAAILERTGPEPGPLLAQTEENFDARHTEWEKHSSTVKQITELTARMTRHMEVAKQHEAEMAELDKELSGLEFGTKDLEDARLSEVNLSEKWAEAASKVRTLQSALDSSTCPTCHRPYEDHDPAALQAAVDLVRSERDRYADQLKEQRSNVAEIEKALSTAGINQRRLQTVTEYRQNSLDAHHKCYEELSNLPPKSDVEERMRQAELKRDALRDDIARLRRDVADLQETERLIQQAGANVEYHEKELAENPLPEGGELLEEPLVAECNEKRRCVNECTAECNRLNTDLQVRKQELKGLLALIEERKAANERRKAAQDELVVVQKLQKYLRDNRDRFVAGVWAGLLQYASAFLSTATGGFLSEIKRSDDGEFSYVMDDFDMPVSAASGAQKSIMGLAVQAALSQLMPAGFPTVMLDEPTADMDPEHALAVSTLLSSMGGQCLMVSHRELDSSIANNSIQLG